MHMNSTKYWKIIIKCSNCILEYIAKTAKVDDDDYLHIFLNLQSLDYSHIEQMPLETLIYVGDITMTVRHESLCCISGFFCSCTDLHWIARDVLTVYPYTSNQMKSDSDRSCFCMQFALIRLFFVNSMRALLRVCKKNFGFQLKIGLSYMWGCKLTVKIIRMVVTQ